MKAIITRLALSAVSLVVTPPRTAPAGEEHPQSGIIVSTGWVADRLKDPNLVLFQVGERPEYDSLHLPGAQFLQTRDISAPFTEGGLALQLPETGMLDSVLEARGVSDSSVIVIYPGKDWFTPSARAYLTLDYFGLGARTHLMDGGMQAWIAEGKPVTSSAPSVTPGRLTPHPRGDVIVTKEWLAARLSDPNTGILDAHNPEFYTGRDTGNASRPGHIPGARSLPFDSLVDSTGHFKTADRLRAMYEACGMAEGKTAVSYCHIGQQASLVYVMARVLGYEARMYDGSMQEWTRDPAAPLVTGSSPGAPPK